MNSLNSSFVQDAIREIQPRTGRCIKGIRDDKVSNTSTQSSHRHWSTIGRKERVRARMLTKKEQIGTTIGSIFFLLLLSSLPLRALAHRAGTCPHHYEGLLPAMLLTL